MIGGPKLSPYRIRLSQVNAGTRSFESGRSGSKAIGQVVTEGNLNTFQLPPHLWLTHGLKELLLLSAPAADDSLPALQSSPARSVNACSISVGRKPGIRRFAGKCHPWGRLLDSPAVDRQPDWANAGLVVRSFGFSGEAPSSSSNTAVRRRT
jgi:hypothetical protein